MTKREYIERYGEEAYQRQLDYQKQYNKEHKEERNQYNKKYREEHKQYYKKYREEHREEHKQYLRMNKAMFAYCVPEQIEQVENYELAKVDNFNGWCIHHRLETHTSDGEKRLVDLSRMELFALDMYYNRPANELIFLTRSEHTSLHNINKRKAGLRQ
jgi:hypothetical protein